MDALGTGTIKVTQSKLHPSYLVGRKQWYGPVICSVYVQHHYKVLDSEQEEQEKQTGRYRFSARQALQAKFSADKAGEMNKCDLWHQRLAHVDVHKQFLKPCRCHTFALTSGIGP